MALAEAMVERECGLLSRPNVVKTSVKVIFFFPPRGGAVGSPPNVCVLSFEDDVWPCLSCLAGGRPRAVSERERCPSPAISATRPLFPVLVWAVSGGAGESQLSAA